MFQAVYDTVVMWPHYTAFVIKQEVLINDHQTKSKLNNVFKIRQCRLLQNMLLCFIMCNLADPSVYKENQHTTQIKTTLAMLYSTN